MRRDWTAFIRAVEKAPKEFAKAVVDCLDPPKYAKKALRGLEYLCGWPGCWTVRTDLCFKCHLSVCDEHSETILGPKTKLEWYVCNGCLANNPREELLKEISVEDDQFWLEDQEAEAMAAMEQGEDEARAQWEDEERAREERDEERSYQEGGPPFTFKEGM